MNRTVVFVKLHPEAKLPEYKSMGASGCDLYALESRLIEPMARVRVPTGVSIELPPGYEGQVRPRSGLALSKGLTCLNSPGTIDSDYRGEIDALLVNLSGEPQRVEAGERVAQLVIVAVERASFHVVDTLAESGRGADGWGSTGQK